MSLMILDSVHNSIITFQYCAVLCVHYPLPTWQNHSLQVFIEDRSERRLHTMAVVLTFFIKAPKSTPHVQYLGDHRSHSGVRPPLGPCLIILMMEGTGQHFGCPLVL